MAVKVTIDTNTIVRIVLVVVLFWLALSFIVAVKTALIVIMFAFFLALALNPPVSLLASRMPRDSRALATGVAYLTVLAVLGLFVYIAIPPLVRETSNLIRNLPDFANEIKSSDGIIGDVIRRYNLDEEARNLAGAFSDWIARGDSPLLATIQRVTGSFIAVLTVLVLTFLMLVEGPYWLDAFWAIYPERYRKEHRELAYRMYRVVIGFVNGQLLVATVAGLTSFVFMIIPGVVGLSPQTALPLAGFVTLTSLIPMIGATLGAIAVTAVALFKSVTAGIAMLIFFLVYQQIENNAIQPFIQSRTLEISPLLVLVAVILGFTAGGFVGGFVAIPVAGCIRVLFKYYIEKRMGKSSKAAVKEATT